MKKELKIDENRNSFSENASIKARELVKIKQTDKDENFESKQHSCLIDSIKVAKNNN